MYCPLISTPINSSAWNVFFQSLASYLMPHSFSLLLHRPSCTQLTSPIYRDRSIASKETAFLLSYLSSRPASIPMSLRKFD